MYLSQRSRGSSTCPSASITLYVRAIAGLLCSVAPDLAGLDVDLVAPRSHRPHRFEAVFDHVAVELDAVAVRIREVHAPRDVVLDRGLHLDADRLELAIRRLQLFEAPELPRRVVQAGLLAVRRLAAGRLEQRQVVVLLAEAQEDGAARAILVRQLEPEGPHVEVLRLLRVPDPQHDVAELPRLDHGWPPFDPSVPRLYAFLKAPAWSSSMRASMPV